MDHLEDTQKRFREIAPEVDYWSLRIVEDESETLSVRQGVAEPSPVGFSRGAMVTLARGGGIGYAATSDLSREGLRLAAERAAGWAEQSAAHALFNARLLPRSSDRGEYLLEPEQPWDSISTEAKLGLLQDACTALKIHDRVVDWSAWLGWHRRAQLLVTSTGGHIAQQAQFIQPGLAAVANRGSQTQRRTGGGGDSIRQGGLEQLALLGFPGDATRVAEEALALVDAPDCPSGTLDLVLLPSQMALQIHESIGHPLELDRILGDERNYAGTSFVTPEMFGSYRYGSELLNVTFDPEVEGEVASFRFDDDGSPARRTYLIRDGLLERPLGGALSQARSGLSGVANARACSWNRPPIDRMANLNLEPGADTLADLIARVERGVLLDTNRSWSIDDSRNKFQFGCELGRLIEDGELRGIVRNPNYRGISATFWRSLAGVGDRSGFEVRGVANCGKGEPNQQVYVGHASPPCLFRDVAVFGGEE